MIVENLPQSEKNRREVGAKNFGKTHTALGNPGMRIEVSPEKGVEPTSITSSPTVLSQDGDPTGLSGC